MTIRTRALAPDANEDRDAWTIIATSDRGQSVALYSPSPTLACHRSAAQALAALFDARLTGRAARLPQTADGRHGYRWTTAVVEC